MAVGVSRSALLRDRQRRLPNALVRKADELERMLFSMLPRVDSSFHSEVVDCVNGDELRYRLRCRPGRLEVELRCRVPSGVIQRLFTLLVESARATAWWERWLLRRPRRLPRRVVSRGPFFAGSRTEDLLRWTVRERHRGGAAAAAALEHLRTALVGEISAAVDFLNELEFADDEDSGEME